MAGRRTYGSYDDGCAAAHALDIIGERWSMSIVRELLLGPKRFAALQRDVVGIGPTILARRLDGLASKGVLRRTKQGGDGVGNSYELTEWGYRLEHVNAALAEWGAQSMTLPLDAAMTPDTIVLAMRAHIDKTARGAKPRRVLLKVRDARDAEAPAVNYLASQTSQGLEILRLQHDASSDVDAIVACSTEALKRVIIAGGAWDRGDADVRISGDPVAVGELMEATRFRTSDSVGSSI